MQGVCLQIFKRRRDGDYLDTFSLRPDWNFLGFTISYEHVKNEVAHCFIYKSLIRLLET